MTNSHDFKAAREGFDILCKMQSDLELPRLYKDAEKTIRFALQLAEKVCGEPSEAMLDALCGWKEKRNSYYALREQILKEIEQGDGQ